MSEESDDSDSSDSSDSRQKMFTAAGMVLCIVQFAFFVGMILMFMEMDFAQGSSSCCSHILQRSL
jgi:hypothetical protein